MSPADGRRRARTLPPPPAPPPGGRRRAGRARPRRAVLALLTVIAALAAPPRAASQCLAGGTSALPPPVADALREYRASFRTPTHLAVDGAGNVYAADPQRRAVLVRAADGRVIDLIEGLGSPNSVAVTRDGARIYVGDGVAGRVTAYDADWARLFDLGVGAGELESPTDIDIDQTTGDVWVTDQGAHQVKVYDAGGAPRFHFGSRGSAQGQFQSPAGIFLDPVADEVLVADQQNGRVQIFDRSGSFKSCIGVRGVGSGRLNNPFGIWADELGRIFVSDAFEGWVHVLDRSGATVARIGEIGVGRGRLTTPTDLVVDPFGRMFVTSSTTARLSLFGLDVYDDPERFVPAELGLSPARLDRSAPTPVVARFEVPGYRVELLQLATLSANGVAATAGSARVGDADGDHVPDVTVSFDGSLLATTLPPSGTGAVRVSGRLGELEAEGFATLEVVGSPADDEDADGIPDSADLCPGTAAGAPTDDGGCGLGQLCPCAGPAPGESWLSHGHYVRCVAHGVLAISRPPLARVDQVRLKLEAAGSSCGEERGQP